MLGRRYSGRDAVRRTYDRAFAILGAMMAAPAIISLLQHIFDFDLSFHFRNFLQFYRALLRPFFDWIYGLFAPLLSLIGIVLPAWLRDVHTLSFVGAAMTARADYIDWKYGPSRHRGWVMVDSPVGIPPEELMTKSNGYWKRVTRSVYSTNNRSVLDRLRHLTGGVRRVRYARSGRRIGSRDFFDNFSPEYRGTVQFVVWNSLVRVLIWGLSCLGILDFIRVLLAMFSERGNLTKVAWATTLAVTVFYFANGVTIIL